MAYVCPRCGGAVSRDVNSNYLFGLVGVLFSAAFGGFSCAKCGKIPHGEFTPEERSRMTMGSVGFAVGALALAALVIWLISLRGS